MKKYLLLILLSCGSLLSNAAQQGYSLLQVGLSDHSPLAVKIDGRFIDQQTVWLKMDGITPGSHRVSVYKMARNMRPIRVFSGTLILDPNVDYTALVDINRHVLNLRSDYPDEGDDDRYGANGGPGYDRDHHDGRDGHDDHYGTPAPQGTPVEEPINDPNQQGYGSYPRGRDGNHGNMNNANMLSPGDMNDLKLRVNDRITDSEKEKLLESVLANRNFTCAQTRVILSWLWFESGKLVFAKWAYPHVIDRQDYWKLEDVFMFTNAKDEFNRAISGR